MFTTPVSVASYFQFPSVPNDGQVYIVRVDSSLSSLNYHYIRPESTVTATGVRAHVTFKFDPQVSPLVSIIDLQEWRRRASRMSRHPGCELSLIFVMSNFAVVQEKDKFYLYLPLLSDGYVSFFSSSSPAT